MITHLRIDNRLIHGQVAVTWMNAIGADKIIVCNDQVASDPIQKVALPLAARGNTVYIFTIDETLKYAKEHLDETIFLICKLPTDALAILKSGLEVKTVNVGNAAPPIKGEFKMVNKSIAVTPEEAEVYREIAALRGGKLTSQLTPINSEDDFLALLNSKF